MEIVNGAHPTVITPYTKEGEVDYETLKKYIKWYGDNGCTGVFSLCHSSEIAQLTADEMVKFNRTVYDTAMDYNKNHDNKLNVVTSGHIWGSITEQAKVLNRIAETGTDALVLVTNRFDPDNTGDEKWIEDAEKLLKLIPKDIPLGLYECPLPYKRLASPKIFEWCLSTGRFVYMKDTCCDMEIINNRLSILKGSKFKLFNANCQTLRESLLAGASGYCGIMCNFHPRLYAWMLEHYKEDSKKVKLLQDFIGTLGFIENGLPYPLTAKYNMNLCGIPTENFARNRISSEMTPYGENCIEQMKEMADYVYSVISAE